MTVMAEKIDVTRLKAVLFSEKPVSVCNKALSDPAAEYGIGSAAAEATANATAMALLAVNSSDLSDPAVAKAAGDLETLRTYFLRLIDEEVKCKEPLEKRLAEGAPAAEIEGGYRTACVIIDEVLYSGVMMLEQLDRVADKISAEGAPAAAASVYFVKTAMQSVRLLKGYYSTKMNEEVFARTTRREPELAIEENEAFLNGLIEKFEAKIL